MKKERLLWLDAVRAAATILIVLTHFNALYLYDVYRPEMAVLSCYIGNIYIGALGVSLFLIISGASLMYTLQDKEMISWKEFYSRRFQGIYPMFWIAYVIFFLFYFYQWGGINTTVPLKNILFSFLGFDGYLSNWGIPTFYFIGEWFLGFILLFYFVFPILFYWIQKYPLPLGAATIFIYGLMIFSGRNYQQSNILLPTRLPELLFGMYFIKYQKQVSSWEALLSLLVIILNTILAPTAIHNNIQVTYIGIASFLLLVYLANHIKSQRLTKLFQTISKYSFSCFLVHHQIIVIIAAKFDLANITKLNSHLLFLACGLVIIVMSRVLYCIDHELRTYFFIKGEHT